MRKIITIGDKDVTLEINGATPIYYNRMFHKNLFTEISGAEKDAVKSAEIVPEIAYVMAMQAEGRQKEMSDNEFISWLENYTLFDLVNGTTSGEIIGLFMAGSNPTVDSKKKQP